MSSGRARVARLKRRATKQTFADFIGPCPLNGKRFHPRVEYWSLPSDASSRAHTMPRNSALLYRNRNPKDSNSPPYRGVLKLDDNRTFWVGAWRVTVNGEPVIELRLIEKRNDTAK
jgi:hypothetical protein